MSYSTSSTINVPENLKLVVFDLDDTLHFSDINMMPKHVIDILTYFHRKGIPIALASLNTDAPRYLVYYNVSRFFEAVEWRVPIDESGTATNEHQVEFMSMRKNKMFERLMTHFNVNPSEVLFFDDLWFNIADIESMGVNCVLVDKDVCVRWRDVYRGFAKMKQRA